MNSRRKGAVGELEFAKWLQERGVKARRGQQFSGSPDSPDVVVAIRGGFHFEVKRVEAIRLWDAIAQAKSDCGGKRWAIAHRRNRTDWVAIISMELLVQLLARCGDVDIPPEP